MSMELDQRCLELDEVFALFFFFFFFGTPFFSSAASVGSKFALKSLNSEYYNTVQAHHYFFYLFLSFANINCMLFGTLVINIYMFLVPRV